MTARPAEPTFSVIIPTLNEANTLETHLNALLDSIEQASPIEIILSDGGSRDDTLDIARRFPLKIINSAKGRALQMNAGAAAATAQWLIFLHADTRLPDHWMQQIEQCGADWGRFDVRLDGRHWLFRIIEKAINLRSCISAVATGDQALFFRHDLFQQLGAFPQIPLMEDVALSKRARKHSRPACLRGPVITSARRWRKGGILRTGILMWTLRLAYWLGVKPETLHGIYYQ